MSRRRLVRLQLILLAILAVLVFVRWVVGPPAPDGLVVFTDLDDEEVRHAAFELEAPAQLSVQARGSFERSPNGTAAPPLAAYAWIVHRADRAVAWRMDPARAFAERGTVASVADTIRLPAGVYDVYFASHGNAFRQEGPWTGDASRWRLVMRTVSGGPAVARNDDLYRAAPSGADLLWTSAPTGRETQKAFTFQVHAPTALRAYALGEMEPHNAMDYGWIEDAVTREKVWTMTYEATRPAGGPSENRLLDTAVSLEPGFYRAVYRTDANHDARRWRANPPYDVAAWGLSLFAQDTDAVSALDPWQLGTPVLRLTQVPDDARWTQRFRVAQPTTVVVSSTGEITGPGDAWDYGQLLRETPSGAESIWKMSWETSQPAGGSKKNRTETAFLTLAPGTYTLAYRTDGSHAYDDWNADRPDYPNRWGAALFTLDGAGAIQALGPVHRGRKGDDDRPMAPPAPPAPGVEVEAIKDIEINVDAEVRRQPGDLIVAWTQVEADFSGTHVLELGRRPARLFVEATGEHTMQGWHDHAWIEDARSGARVWEMTMDNTRPAGGDDRNRRFQGHVDLPPGQYRIRYVTDQSHHHGDFGVHRPEAGTVWGMTVRYLEEPAS